MPPIIPEEHPSHGRHPVREGFDPSDAIDFWDKVNRQDWHVCELTQMGVRSRGYTAGRYTTHEYDVHAFDRMVAERYMAALRAESPVAP